MSLKIDLFISIVLILGMKVIIFDWDDTLFPSKILKFQFPRNDIENIKEFPDIIETMKKLEQNILDSLEKLIRPDYKIVIVTNAYRSWISKGLTIWNKLQEFIMNHKIDIYYPREDCDLMYSKEDKNILAKSIKNQDFYTFIKLDAFFSVAKKYSPQEIISIGDSRYEYIACCSMESDKLKVIPLYVDNQAMDLVQFQKQILNAVNSFM